VIPDPAPPYAVDLTGTANDEIRSILTRAVSMNQGPMIVPVLEEIGELLRMRPTSWGDPLFRLRNMNATVYRGVLQPLMALYSVHDRIPIVTLWHMYAVPGHALSGDDNGESK
jgi:hypothetical protein